MSTTFRKLPSNVVHRSFGERPGTIEYRDTWAPQRIQRQRTKGWRMPEGAIYVGRPSRWGNPFSMTRAATEVRAVLIPETRAIDRFVLAIAYRKWITAEVDEHLTIDLAPLRGHDLACWCPLEDEHGNHVPCHADVLLELANR